MLNAITVSEGFANKYFFCEKKFWKQDVLNVLCRMYSIITGGLRMLILSLTKYGTRLSMEKQLFSFTQIFQNIAF